MKLLGMGVRTSPRLWPGTVVFLPPARMAFVRHMSELFLRLSGVAWHANGHCPTWTDADECRCMLGGEA